MRHAVVGWVALAALAGAGCGGEATCEKAVAHIEELSGEKLGAEQRAEAVAKCKKESLSREALRCIVKARDMAAVAACERPGEPGGAERYARRSKTAEAVANVKKIYLGARYYYEEETVGATGQLVPKQFPASAGPTPAAGSCCAGAGKKCRPDPAVWQAPTWQALKFELSDPHYCWYTFESAGGGIGAAFSARANCDLDCDGEYSTFEMVGRVEADGTVGGSAAMFKQDELE